MSMTHITWAFKAFCLIFVWAISGNGVQADRPEYFNVGIMFPISTTSGKAAPTVKYMAAMDIAIDAINNKHDGLFDDILPLTELRMVVRSPLRTFGLGANAATSMLAADNGKGVIACAGPAASNAMKGVFE